MGLTGFHLTSAPLLGFQLSARLPALTCPLVTALLCFTSLPTSTLATKTVTVAEGIVTAKADQVWLSSKKPYFLGNTWGPSALKGGYRSFVLFLEGLICM